jgi:hypothetical protein
MKKTISHAVFGKLSRYDDHVYSTVHWASQLVQIVIYASDQTVRSVLDRSVGLLTNQEIWIQKIEKCVKRRIEQGAADFIVPKELRNKFIESLKLVCIEIRLFSEGIGVEFLHHSSLGEIDGGVSRRSIVVSGYIDSDLDDLEIRGGD